MRRDRITLVLRITWSNLLYLGAAAILGTVLGVSITQSYCNEHQDYAELEFAPNVFDNNRVEPPPVTRL